VLGNDSDADGDPLTVTGVSQGANGTVILNADGTVIYRPNPNFNGTDSFTYTISDGRGGLATARVAVTVSPVNDPPVARDDLVPATEDNAATINVRGNDGDADGDPLTITAVTQPASGRVAINLDGTVTYTPNPGFVGTDTFTYTITDSNGGTSTARVTLEVGPVNDAPVARNDFVTAREDQPVTIAVLGNDGDPDADPLTITAVAQPTHGTVTVNPDGTVTYTPNPNFNGIDTFTYTVSDVQGGTSTAAVTVTVGAVNDTPVAVNDPATTSEGSPVTVDVRANDSDPDGDPLTIIAVTQGANGTVVVNPDGTVTYTPNPDFNGTDVFTYTVADGNGAPRPPR
jgi:CshA-type fibril repeat protein